jgi:hypothetical protein
MKDIKKVLACVVAVATLGTVMAIPANAITLKQDEETTTVTTSTDGEDTDATLEYYQQNAVWEAVIVLNAPEAGEDAGTYYFLGGVIPSIDVGLLSDDDLTTIAKFLPIKIDDTIDVSNVETTITIDSESDSANYIPVDVGQYYTHLYYNYSLHEWLLEESVVKKPEDIEDTTTQDEDDSEGSSVIVEFPYSADDDSKTVVYDDVTYSTVSDSHSYILPDGFDIEDVINGNGVLQLNGKKFTLSRVGKYGPLDDPILDVYVLTDEDGVEYMYTKSYNGPSSNQLLEGTGWLFSPSPESYTSIKYVSKQTETTIGDSDTTEPTIGDSTTSVDLNETPTNVRGDVNYDGQVNAVDLLLLKKYLLKLITW